MGIIISGFIRGGNWNNGSNAGVFALNLNNSPDNQNNNIGFRCASDFVCAKHAIHIYGRGFSV